MSNRRQLLWQALSERLREVCAGRIRPLIPDEFGEHSWFVSTVQQQVVDASTEVLQQRLQTSDTWQQSETSGLVGLQQLALGERPSRPVSKRRRLKSFLSS